MVKDTPANAGDPGLIPRLGRSPGGGNGSPLQYSCLENPMDREAWPARVHGVSKSQTWLSNWELMQDQSRGLLCSSVPTTFPYPWFCHRVGSWCSLESYHGKSRPGKMTAFLCGNLVGSAEGFEFWARPLEIILCYKWSSLFNSPLSCLSVYSLGSEGHNHQDHVWKNFPTTEITMPSWNKLIFNNLFQ